MEVKLSGTAMYVRIGYIFAASCCCFYFGVFSHGCDWESAAACSLLTKVFLSDRFNRTAGHRFRLTGPVGPVTGSDRSNSKPNSNVPVLTVSTG